MHDTKHIITIQGEGLTEDETRRIQQAWQQGSLEIRFFFQSDAPASKVIEGTATILPLNEETRA